MLFTSSIQYLQTENNHNAGCLNQTDIKQRETQVVPLFILMGQKEVLHLLPTEVDLVLVVAFDGFCLVHGVIKGQQELFKTLHYWRRRTQIHVMDVPKSDGGKKFGGELRRKKKNTVEAFKIIPQL